MSAPNRRCSSKLPVPPKSLPVPPTTRGVWNATLKVPSAHWGAVGTTLRTTSLSEHVTVSPIPSTLNHNLLGYKEVLFYSDFESNYYQ